MAHIVFREQLGLTYPTYGTALWDPSPGRQHEAVEVGDVGFVRKGHFHRLFNVLLPRDHPSNQHPIPAPEDHEQLELRVPFGHILMNEIHVNSGQNATHLDSKHVMQTSQGLGPLASR